MSHFCADLKEWYYNFVTREQLAIYTLSFYETKPLPGIGMVVDPGDADPGVPHAGLYPIGEDHNLICKPKSKESLLYLSILQLLNELFPLKSVVESQYQFENLTDQVPPNFR